MSFLKAIIASFWPQQRRRWWFPESQASFEHAGLAGAVFQVLIFGFIFSLRYHALIRTLESQFGSAAYGTDMVLLLLAFVSEFFDPIGLPSLYLAMEGAVRGVAVLAIGEVYPSLPVFAAVALRDCWTKARVRTIHQRLLSETTDHVEQVGEMLIVSSVLPKEEWDGAAIDLRGRYYQAAGPHPGTAARPYSYILRPWPSGMVLRRVRQYEGDAEVAPDEAPVDRGNQLS